MTADIEFAFKDVNGLCFESREHKVCKLKLSQACYLRFPSVLIYTGTTTVAQQDVPTLSTMTDGITTQPPSEATTLHQTVTTKTSTENGQTDPPDYTDSFSTEYPEQYDYCPSQLPCNQLSGDCLDCNMTSACIYGRQYNITCMPKSGLDCTVSPVFVFT